MPDAARRHGGRTTPTWLAVAALLAAAALAPHAALATESSLDERDLSSRIVTLAPPTETCGPGETRGAGDFSDICSPATAGGGGGINVSGLLPILGVAVVGGLALLLAAFVILRRTSTPLVAADPGEWWTCRTCGKTNVVGSARCYACGAWQR